MGKITEDMVVCVYQTANEVYRGELSKSEGSIKVSSDSGMNMGSARDYITAFVNMMEGKAYTRTINLFATEYYLECIGKDYGREAQRKAAQATLEHVEYYKSVHGYLAKADKLARKYL